MLFAVLACVATVFGACVFSLGCSAVKSSPDIAPHLVATADEAPVRPIDGFETEALPELSDELDDERFRARVEDLYLIVTSGKKPIFAENDPVEPVYDGAIALLDRYILNKWHDEGNDYAVVHAVHDYLVTAVEYDFELYESFKDGNTAVEDSPSFRIDGVLLNKKAVCDGLARTVNFLLAIEGIDSIRVTGTYSGGMHAWNKVRLDGKWYNIDVTADSANYIGDNGAVRKQLSHGFFLLSDETLRSRVGAHSGFINDPEFSAVEDYDYFEDKMTALDGHASVVTDQAALNSLFAAIAAAKGGVGKIEIKLEFAGKANVNNVDMYEAELAEAYSKVKNAHFSLDLSRGQKPYFQYPNGVYLILVYR